MDDTNPASGFSFAEKSLLPPDPDEVLTVALDICEGMLESGAEIHRVEDTAERICRAYGAEKVEIFAITSLIVATISMADGKDCTQARRVYGNANNLFRIEKLNALSRTICRDTPHPSLVKEEIADIRNRESFPKFLKYAGGFLGAFGFTLFFGGGILEAFIAGFIGIAVCALDFNRPKYLNQIAYTAIVSAAGSLMIALFCRLLTQVFPGLGINTAVINIGVIMLLIPGMALGNAVRDLLCGEVVSGAVKGLQSLLVATAIAGGFTVILLLLGSNNVYAVKEVHPLLMILYSGLGTIGFSILFGVPARQFLYAVICGMLGCASYLAASHLELWGISPVIIASVIGGAACTFYAEIFARVNKTPTTVFLIPGLIPLVPGGALYYTMAYLVQRDRDLALSRGLDTLYTCIGIAIGIVLVSVLFQVIVNAVRNAREKRRRIRKEMKEAMRRASVRKANKPGKK